MNNPQLIPGGGFPNRAFRPFPYADEPTPPQNTVAPVLSGVPAVGNLLTVTNGTWTGASSFTYSWYRNGTKILGATSSTYLLVAADQGTVIRAVVIGTGPAGSASAQSNPLGPIT